MHQFHSSIAGSHSGSGACARAAGSHFEGPVKTLKLGYRHPTPHTPASLGRTPRFLALSKVKPNPTALSTVLTVEASVGCLPLARPLAVLSSEGSSSCACKEEKNHVCLRNPAPAVTRILKKEATGWAPELRTRWGTSEAAGKHASAPLARLHSSPKKLSSTPPPSTDWTGPRGGARRGKWGLQVHRSTGNSAGKSSCQALCFISIFSSQDPPHCKENKTKTQGEESQWPQIHELVISGGAKI